MTSAEIYQWMADPSLLTTASLPELKQLVADYPCFHAIRILYLKNLAMLNDVRLAKELKKMTVHVPDRRQLFLLLNDNNHRIQARERSKTRQATAGQTSPDLSESQHKETDRPVVENMLQPAFSQNKSQQPPVVVATSDYVRWLEEHAEDLPVENGVDSRFRHQDIIDSVIENGLNISAAASATANAENSGEHGPDTEKKSHPNVVDTIALDESYFTETLARVYINQKRYDKALDIFRVLSLKYPEKSIYFAAQIQSLENIIHN